MLTQRAIDAGNEIAAFAATLDILPDLREVLVTADALHTQREHATYLHRRGAHYLFMVKRNQPTLHAALAGLPWAAVDRRLRRQSGHGRTASRSIAVLAADGAGGIDDLFPRAAQVMRVIRCRTATATGKRSRQVVYAITFLDHRQADPELLADWLQDHGGSRTASITSATSPTVRTLRGSAPAPGRSSWPRSATPTSTSPGCAARPTSPPPSAATPGPAAPPPTPSTPHDQRTPLRSGRHSRLRKAPTAPTTRPSLGTGGSPTSTSSRTETRCGR